MMYSNYHYNFVDGVSYPATDRFKHTATEGSYGTSLIAPDNQIYSTSLLNLNRHAAENIEQYRNKLTHIDPYYDYNNQFIGPKYERSRIVKTEAGRQNWDDKDVLFTNIDQIKRIGWQTEKQEYDIEKPSIKNSETPNKFCYLCSTVEEHQRHLARRGPQLKAKEKPKPRIQYIAPPPIIKNKAEEIEEKEELLYKVSVTTGRQPQAATSANVFIRIRGKNGSMKKRPLKKKQSVNFVFGRCTTENFFFKGPNVGELKWLTVEHDGLEKKHGWFLEKVEVTIVQTEDEFIFPCHQWLSLFHADYKVKRHLQAERAEFEPTEYEVSITTADKLGAGTDANVFLTIYGKRGVSRKFPLKDRSRNNFEAGETDIFTVKVIKDIGPLTKIRLEHDNSGAGPGWFVEKVKLEDLTSGKHYNFPCGQWLAKDEGDKQIFKDLYHDSRKSAKGSKGEYEVSVTTAKKFGAGTDANVFITLCGTKGNSKKCQLDDNKNNFESGDTDRFHIDIGKDIGKLKKIRIEHDNSGAGPGWLLDKVTIEDLSTGDLYSFPCHQWLAEDEGDGQICRELYHSQSDRANQPDTTIGEYDVTVVTSKKFGAGTDANVFITLFGKKGTSKKCQLDDEKNNFESGDTDKFRINIGKDIGTLKKIRLEHDNSGAGPGWHVDKVQIEDLATGQLYAFPCNNWLSKKDGDGQISRDLDAIVTKKAPSKSKGQKHAQERQHHVSHFSSKKDHFRDDQDSMIKYECTVITGTVANAGTDAHVFVMLFGKLGKSREITLDEGKDHFEKGQTDVFLFKAEDVGEIKRIAIRHDNKGLAAGWFVEKIIIRRYFSRTEVHDRLAMMADEMHQTVSNITGDETIKSPRRKKSSLKYSHSENAREMETRKETRWKDREDEKRKSNRRNTTNEKKHRWDEEESMKKKQRRKKKGKYDSDTESDSEDEVERPQKKKKAYKYGGIEVLVTESDTESEYSDYDEPQKKHSNRKNGHGSRTKHYDPDHDERKKKDRKKKYYSSSDSDDTRSHSRSRQNKKYISEREQEDEFYKSSRNKSSTKQHHKNKRDKKKRHDYYDDSSSSDEEVYTKWTKGRIPYCDEYVFECHKWLATDEGDGQIEREFKPKTITTFYKVDG